MEAKWLYEYMNMAVVNVGSINVSYEELKMLRVQTCDTQLEFVLFFPDNLMMILNIESIHLPLRYLSICQTRPNTRSLLLPMAIVPRSCKLCFITF